MWNLILNGPKYYDYNDISNNYYDFIINIIELIDIRDVVKYFQQQFYIDFW